MKAVQEALLDGELGEEVRKGSYKDEDMEGCRAGVAGHVGADGEGDLSRQTGGHAPSLIELFLLRCPTQNPFSMLFTLFSCS